MSRRLAPLLTGALALVPTAVLAQDQTLPVFFEVTKDQRLNDAIATALTKPPFVLQTRYMSSALVVAIPDRVTVDRQPDGSVWTFTVTFHRDGDSLGQSVESCSEHKLSDCTDQLVSDAKSAAGIGQ